MKVLLLAGGESSERQVSLDSGKAIYQALIENGHEVCALDPATGKSLIGANGSFVLSELSIQRGLTVGGHLEHPEEVLPELASALTMPDVQDIDVVFIGLHGGMGENGTIQALLDLSGKKYTGSSMRASAVAMNKEMSKRIASSAGVTTPLWHLIDKNDPLPDLSECERIIAQVGLPCIVKPNDGGSTVGLSVVNECADFASAIALARNECDQVLCEQYIKGRELTVAVVDHRALPVVEIRPESGLYDYTAKYTKGMSEYFCPAEIADEIMGSIQSDALTMYKKIGASGLARIDFMLNDQNVHYFLELNTLPGMTSLSLAPMAAKAVGIDFNQLVQLVLDSALKG